MTLASPRRIEIPVASTPVPSETSIKDGDSPEHLGISVGQTLAISGIFRISKKEDFSAWQCIPELPVSPQSGNPLALQSAPEMLVLN